MIFVVTGDIWVRLEIASVVGQRAGMTVFQTALTWPEAQQRIQALLQRGLQREGDFENRWPALFGTLLET
jgi:hypothetical protein